LKDATDESTPLGKSVKNLGEQFGILFDALAGGKSDVDGTTDTLSGLADIVSFLVTTMASFVAFLQTLGPAIDALLKGDVEKFWDWLNSDPIEFLNNQQAAEDALKQTGEEFRNTADSARRLNNISLDKLRGQLGDVTIDGKKLADQQRELYYAMRGEKPPKTTTTTTTTNTNTGGKTQKEIREEQIKAAREAFEKVQKLVKATQQKIIDAQSSYDKAVSKANSDYLRNVSKLREDYAAKLEDIVLSSQNRLRDAFRSAVSGSLSEMFGTDADKGVATLVENLRKRVIASRQLIENSSQLASLGFTQTFIEQVASAGLETGNELASAILKSTPQTQAELKSLFLTLEDTSETGMDALAKTIFEKQGLATRELRNLYDKAGEDLNRALAEQQKLLAETLEAAAVQLRDKLREIKDDFEEDIGELKGAYGGLKSAIDAVNGSLDTMIGKSQTAVNGAAAAAAKAAGVTNATSPEAGKAATPNSDLGGGFRTFGDPETVNRMLALQAAGEALGMYNQGFVDMVLKTQRSFRRGTEEKTVGGLISPDFVKQLLAEGFTEITAPKVNPDKLALALALAEQIYGADIGGISTPGQVGGNTFNISVNAGMGTDPISVGAQIVDAIKRYERSSGQVFASV
jgi:F0F1-type ATP synthase membrane subunit b/b'